MKKNIIINAVMMLLLIVLSSSCKKDQEIGGTAVQNLSGDWYVRVNNTGAYVILSTYNTSANVATEMWVRSTALKAGTTVIGIQGKVAVDVGNQAFTATNTANIAATKTTIPTFSVANGKVVTNGTTGPVSKTPTDSISFDLTINGVTYKVEGYHRTGFMLDEQP
ncbi:lipid-binding protein [Pedobacter hartonius]|uniref:Lipid-binding putative hydrolase n=1 Tax=Pedobacter hartonius TaxID=425514 RepID=A0A1H4F5V1_9SPHI|nr:lipid-binding protein [Pedobacter hartonius]SEA92735.1 Lipid-binding putative hydrolase [Pedobacter hartonius]